MHHIKKFWVDWKKLFSICLFDSTKKGQKNVIEITLILLKCIIVLLVVSLAYLHKLILDRDWRKEELDFFSKNYQGLCSATNNCQWFPSFRRKLTQVQKHLKDYWKKNPLHSLRRGERQEMHLIDALIYLLYKTITVSENTQYTILALFSCHLVFFNTVLKVGHSLYL